MACRQGLVSCTSHVGPQLAGAQSPGCPCLCRAGGLQIDAVMTHKPCGCSAGKCNRFLNCLPVIAQHDKVACNKPKHVGLVHSSAMHRNCSPTAVMSEYLLTTVNDDAIISPCQ